MATGLYFFYGTSESGSPDQARSADGSTASDSVAAFDRDVDDENAEPSRTQDKLNSLAGRSGPASDPSPGSTTSVVPIPSSGSTDQSQELNVGDTSSSGRDALPGDSPADPPAIITENDTLPEDGDWVRYHGTLWNALTPGRVEIKYVLTLRSVGREFIDGKAHRWIEVESDTQDHHETAKVLISENRYNRENVFEVVRGWVVAEGITVPFDAEKDQLAETYRALKKELPATRLSAHDALALLFGAQVETSNELLKNIRGVRKHGRTRRPKSGVGSVGPHVPREPRKSRRRRPDSSLRPMFHVRRPIRDQEFRPGTA
ncbi:MAG: hypothetical protein N2C14_15925, partial [Planctomycetales bacterium]